MKAVIDQTAAGEWRWAIFDNAHQLLLGSFSAIESFSTALQQLVRVVDEFHKRRPAAIRSGDDGKTVVEICGTPIATSSCTPADLQRELSTANPGMAVQIDRRIRPLLDWAREMASAPPFRSLNR